MAERPLVVTRSQAAATARTAQTIEVLAQSARDARKASPWKLRWSRGDMYVAQNLGDDTLRDVTLVPYPNPHELHEHQNPLKTSMNAQQWSSCTWEPRRSAVLRSPGAGQTEIPNNGRDYSLDDRQEIGRPGGRNFTHI